MATQSRIEQHINIEKAIKDLSTDKVLKVGWPKNIRYPEEEGGKYIAEVAAQNEYGAPHKNIPARPFLGPAVANNKTQWLSIVEKGVKDTIDGKNTILDVLEKLGRKASADVVVAIKEVTSPPLSPVTIAKRLSKLSKKKVTAGLTKPLIDTGIMWRAVTHSVEKE